MKESQLRAALSTLQHMSNVPMIQEIMSANREAPLQWNPLSNFCQFRNQTEASFTEQKYALSLLIQVINKYRSTTGRESTTYTKNTVIYGAPGTGKSFIGQMTVIYCVMQGMNVFSTSLLGVRANALDGIHLHNWFVYPLMTI